MFASAMQRLEREGVRVDVVKCMWLEEEDSTNSDQYLANRAREMTPEQAASNTWSGKILAAYGFTKPYGIISEYGVTTVYFRR